MTNVVKTDWLDPINRIEFQKAFIARAPQVKLRDGRTFSIDYERQPGKAWVNNTRGAIIPCGYFDLQKCTDPLWCSAE